MGTAAHTQQATDTNSSGRYISYRDKAKAKYAKLLRECKNFKEVSIVHEELARDCSSEGTFLGNILVQMYGRYHRIHHAREVFNCIHWKNVFSWTMIITAYAQNGHPREALNMYRLMNLEGVYPDKVAFLSVTVACGELGCLSEAVNVQERVTTSGFDEDIVLANAVVDMFGKCNSVSRARSYFDGILSKDLIAWNTMLAVYVSHSYAREALDLYFCFHRSTDTPPPDGFTYVSLLGACAQLEALDEGKALHRDALESGYKCHLLVATAAVNMYGKCGRSEDAREAFDGSGERDAVLWTSMIDAYAQASRGEDALDMLHNMELEGFKPNLATFVPVIQACTCLSDLRIGRCMHRRASLNKWDEDLVLGTGILQMYAKFGSVREAAEVFDKLRHTEDVISWNCMMMAYVQYGHGLEVLKLYQKMVVEGVNPSDVTFVGILCACSHLGLWEKGHEYFKCVFQDFGIQINEEHYCCMVDLLGRSGRLNEATELIENMSISPGSVLWKVLLSACKTHGNTQLGATAAYNAAQLQPYDHSTYVMISNMFCTSK